MPRNDFLALSAAFSLCFFLPENLLSQNLSAEGNNTISEKVEETFASGDEESGQPNPAEEMMYFLDHPLNLNTATADELRQLHLLTEFQVFSLLEYIRENGILLSVYELQLIYGFDRQLAGKLMPFTFTGPPGQMDVATSASKKKFKQVLVMRSSFPGNKPGIETDSSGNPTFAGANRSVMLRYNAESSILGFGFVMEEDAGESFHSGGKRFFPDFTSAYMEYKNKGLVKKIIIGDFKSSWGQGLVLGGFGTRKGSQTIISPQSTGLRRYNSAGENNFFRGVAAEITLRNLSLEILASRLKSDASLHSGQEDSTVFVYFNSPDLSGLHRNAREISRKDVLTCSNTGAHISFRKGNLYTGISYLNQMYSHLWLRKNTAYTQELFPAGHFIHNIGSDVKVSLGKISAFGEFALDTKARMAIIGGFLAELHPLVRLSMVYRNYRPDYLGLVSNGFGESQGTKNEEGYYLGLQFYPNKYLKTELYADHYSFPFLRYNSTSPYSGNDYLINMSLVPEKRFAVIMRFRYENSQNRSNLIRTGIDRMQTTRKSGLRLEIKYEPDNIFELKSRIEFSYYRNAGNPMTTGFYSGHDFRFQTVNGKYRLWFRYAIYDIPGWDNRIYAYENDVLYSFSVPAYNSKGTRFIIMGKVKIFPGLELSTRYSLSQFPGNINDKKAGDESQWTLQIIYKP